MKSPVIRKVPLYILLLTLYLGAIIVVLFGASVRHIFMGGTRLGALQKPVWTVASFPSLAVKTIKQVLGIRNEGIIEDHRFSEIDGFKKSGQVQKGALEDDGYLLLPTYGNGGKGLMVQLIRIHDQQTIFEWTPDFAEMQTFGNGNNGPENIVNYYAGQPILLENGGLLLGNAWGPLFKIGSCSNVEWLVDEIFHHSVERDAEGNIWSTTLMDPPSYGGKLLFRDDAIVKVSPSGDVLFKKSVAKILIENGYRGLLAAGFDADPIHLNDVQPALTSTAFWDRGDLLLSLRSLSTVFLYRPSTDKIIWLKTGPWMNQHDVDFVSESEISVFGNNVIDNPFFDDKGRFRVEEMVLLDGYQEIYRYDFSDGSLHTPYNDALKAMDVRTLSEGLSEVLPNGDVFVEETNHGRLLRLTPKEVKWEFVNRLDKNHVVMGFWSRYMTKEHVKDILPILQNVSCN